MLIRIGKVVDNNDLDQKSKVKVRILPEMEKFKDSELPWVEPKYNGNSTTSNSGTRHIPEIGSFIYVEIEDFVDYAMKYRQAEWIEGFDIYNKVSELTSITELGTQTYPQPIYFKRFEDGTIHFHNSDTGETGILHKSGSYIVFNSDGQITINPSSQILELGGSSLSEFVVKGNELKTQLETLQAKFSSLITQLQTFVFSGTPATDNPLWQSLLAVTSLLPDPSYTNILSNKVKTK